MGERRLGWTATAREDLDAILDRVHRPDVEVLVAALVLHVENVAAVVAPEVTHDRPLVGGEGLGRVEGFFALLDPDVAHILVRLHEGDPLSVGRDLGARDLWIAEEEFPVDQRREIGSRRRYPGQHGQPEQSDQDGNEQFPAHRQHLLPIEGDRV